MLFFLLFLNLKLEVLLCQDRIYRGAEINITKVPYMLPMQGNGFHFCGAGIISKNWALTAANCVFRKDKKQLSVLSGTANLKSGGKRHRILEVIILEKFRNTPPRSQLFAYNIAVFRVSPPLTFNQDTDLLKLPEKGQSLNDTWGLIAGWGATKKTLCPKLTTVPNVSTLSSIKIYYFQCQPKTTDTLRYIIIPQVDNRSCLKKNKWLMVKRDQICYGLPNWLEWTGGHVHCWGDAGGPLVNSDKIAFAVALWQGLPEKCGWLPGIYTNIRLYRDWIKENTRM